MPTNIFDTAAPGYQSDPWQNLMTFGLATMQAGAQPGARTLGAIGQGGLAAMDASRQNALARGQQQLQGTENASKQLQSMVMLNQINMQRQLSGMPPLDFPGMGTALPGQGASQGASQGAPQTSQAPASASPASNSTGMPFSPTAGSSVREQPQTVSTPSQPGGNQNSPFGIRPEVLQGQMLPSQQEAVQLGRTYIMAGMPEMGKKYLDLAYDPSIAGASEWAKAPAQLFVAQKSPRELGANSSIYQDGQILAQGATEGATASGTPYRLPPRVANNPQNNMSNYVASIAQSSGVDPALAVGVFGQESNFGKNVQTSPAGAEGAMQIMPATARAPGFGVAPATDGDHESNIRQGVQYLGAMHKRYGGNDTLALMAYNWGPGNVDKWITAGANPAQVPKETRDYISGVQLNALNSALPARQQQPAAAPESDVPTDPDIPPGAMQTGISPAQKGFLEKRGEALSNRLTEIDDQAEAAKQSIFMLDQMQDQAKGFRQGAWADYAQSANKYLRLVNPKFDETVGDYESFKKNAIRLTNEEVRQVSSRAAVQEYQAIQSAQPQPEMSPYGFKLITNQLKSVYDYKLARQDAAQNWIKSHPTLEGFEADFNKNVTPTVFLVNRMSLNDLQQMKNNLAKQPGGDKILQNLISKIQYAHQNGLIE